MNEMCLKIALVQPNMPLDCPIPRSGDPQVPLGLLYLASYLQQSIDCEIKIFDSYLEHLDHKKTAKQVLDFNADIVGITSTSLNFIEGRKMAQNIKQENKEVTTVFGGPHPTIYPKRVISLPYVDVVVVGEGEIAFQQYVDAYTHNTSPTKVKALMLKDGEKTLFTGRRPFIPNLDILPFPARHLINIAKYPRYGHDLWTHPVDTINNSRGCPYHCTFCSTQALTHHTYRSMSPSYTVNEIQHLIDNFGTRGIYFREDNFTCKETRVQGICKELKKRNVEIAWECESRVNISKTLLKQMKNVGCKTIWFGVESGSQRILNYLRKGTTISQIKKTIKNCEELDMNSGASFMVGIPTETVEDIELTMKLWKELKTKFSMCSEYVAIPGSELYETVKEQGYFASQWEDVFLVETPELPRSTVKQYLAIIREEGRRKRKRRLLTNLIIHPRYGFNIVTKRIRR